jgi:enoyl-CoA hydratase/carnithine racemase
MKLRHLTVRVSEAVHYVQLSGSALCQREAYELEYAVNAVSAAAEPVRVMVLCSAGPDFCSGPGADLEPLTAGCDPVTAIASCSMPVVAALQGRTDSVGLELALAADLRIADSTARLSFPDVASGRLPCWGGTQRLPRAAGRGTAARMILTGEELDAQQALACGLVHKVSGGDLDRAVDNLVRRLASLPPIALAAAKEALTRGPELPMRHALELEGDLNHLLQTTSDRAEGLAAFLQKRPPHFEGR